MILIFSRLFRLPLVRVLLRPFFLHVLFRLVLFLTGPNYFPATLQATTALFRRHLLPPLLLGKVPSGGVRGP